MELGFPFYRIFNFPRNGKFSKNYPGIPRNFRDPNNLRDSDIRKIPGKFSRVIFPIFIILSFFFIFSISDLIFGIILCCFDKLSISFSIFSTI